MNIEQQAEEYSNDTYRQAFNEEWSIKECLKEAYIAGYNQAKEEFNNYISEGKQIYNKQGLAALEKFIKSIKL